MSSWRNVKASAEKHLPYLKVGTKFIVFDTETTGLGKSAEIIEFAGVTYEILEGYKVREIDSLHLYIKPSIPIPEKITELTGISNDMVKDCETEATLVYTIFNYLHTAKVWIAHNASFDKRMLSQMLQRTHLSTQDAVTLDSCEMARDLINKEHIENHKLGTVIAYLFPDKEFQFHSAIEDVKATGLCVERFIEMYYEAIKGLEKESEEYNVLLEYCSYWVNPHNPRQVRLRMKLNVGEYGEVFWDVVKKCWSCKSSKESKAFFSALSKEHLEKQFIQKYSYLGKNMDAIASEMGKAYRKKKAAKK